MKLSEAIKRIPMWYEFGISAPEHAMPSLDFIGGVGIGKSTIGRETPAILKKHYPKKKLGFSLIYAPLLNLTDAQGWLTIDRPTGSKEPIARFSKPFWWETAEGKRLEEYDGGIILIEERDKAPTDVKPILAEFQLTGWVGPHRIPKGWVVWSTSNRAADRSGSTREFFHSANRVTQIPLEADRLGWEDWAVNKQLLPESIAFAKHNSDLIFNGDLPEVPGPFCTPRSFAAADARLQFAMEHLSDAKLPRMTRLLKAIEDSVTMIELRGTIGPVADQYEPTIRSLAGLPSYDTLMKSPEGTPLPDSPDLQMLLISRLAADIDKYGNPEKDFRKCLTVVQRMSPEWTPGFIKDCLRRRPKLILQPDMKAWTKKPENKEILMTIVS